MARGVIYVQSFYPGDIAIQEKKGIEILDDGKLAIATINRHISALTIDDFSNGIEFTQDGEKVVPKLKVPITVIDHHIFACDGGPDRLLFLVDYTRLDYRRYTLRAFSEILISWEIDHDNPGHEDLDFHAVVLQKFLRTYRHVSRDVSIVTPDRLRRDIPMRMIAVVPYSDAELQMAPKERLLRPRTLQFGLKEASIAEFLRYLPKTNAATEGNTKTLADTLRSGAPLDERSEGLLRAFEELTVNENPTWALLDIFMAAELAIAQFVNRSKIAKGVSKTKLEDFRRDIGVSYMINVDLPLLLSPLSAQERKTIECIDSVRRKRNNVVHEGAVVSKDEALNAINAASHLFDLLKRRASPPEHLNAQESQAPASD
jgi:hypothetical protein